MADTIPKMKDVALQAGVSIKTVSRVLNNEPHVQESVRQKVRAAVELLGYIPSRSARSLRGNKSYNIHLLCHTARSSYVNAIQFGAVLACQELGYQLSLSLPELLLGKSVEQIKTVFQKVTSTQQPDGVLLVAPYANDPNIAKALRELGIRVTRIGPINIENDGTLVQINDQLAAEEITDHLISLGHRKIGFVRGLEDQPATEERFSGYKNALQRGDLDFDPELVRPGAFDFESGFEAGEYFLSLPTPPTAVFAANDDMGAGIIMAALKSGARVPEDLSVAGFDDSELADKMLPALTTVHQPLQELGEIAITHLISSFGSNGTFDLEPTILPHELILRGSTGRAKN